MNEQPIWGDLHKFWRVQLIRSDTASSKPSKFFFRMFFPSRIWEILQAFHSNVILSTSLKYFACPLGSGSVFGSLNAIPWRPRHTSRGRLTRCRPAVSNAVDDNEIYVFKQMFTFSFDITLTTPDRSCKSCVQTSGFCSCEYIWNSLTLSPARLECFV